ncbi:unnamed protein product [Lepeophtheirus salmonis]|uniref:(salmon louse) hypothetical protein n=2 Tax=Lepeophtheirus salmonis TaxID=72036 RepID=A0A7R8H4D0_LEPSM|nr:unnamed protein product [Lepeophtheirus salmonis]CAF2847770.1 unnamed protein product [Lepeophtheirus salmonis]
MKASILSLLLLAFPLIATSSYPHLASTYKYGYDIRDDYHGTNFGASESSYGQGIRGEYHVHLPDGRIQTVSYYDDGNSGLIADVSYTKYGALRPIGHRSVSHGHVVSGPGHSSVSHGQYNIPFYIN